MNWRCRVLALSLRVFCLFYKNKQNVSRSKMALSSSRYDFMGFLSNPMKSLELTKCCFNVTSSLPAFLGRQVFFDRKLYREVKWGCRVLDTMTRLSPLHHSNWQNDRCHFECFVCFTKTSKMYREVRRGLSSSRYDFMGFLSNPMKSLKLTKWFMPVTSSVLFVLQKQAKCIEK